MGWTDDKAFEAEVLRIARAKWPSSAMAGAAMLDGRERDGIFETEESVHFIEATTSRSQDKARYDSKKLHQAVIQQTKLTPMKGARGWFVTAEEPTADQRKEVERTGKGQVVAVSFAQFQQSVIDVAAYLAARVNHVFGSVLDPETRQPDPSTEYVPINLEDRANSARWQVRQICSALQRGERFTLTGQFGAGKSMTLRQIFRELREDYLRGRTALFPVYINLREHTGQVDAVEVLERHARKIGFESPPSLVRAWRAKFCILLLDGFDELTALGVQRATFGRLRTIRKRALEAVRQLVAETPAGVGVIIAGRDHFFADNAEAEDSLGFSAAVTHLTTSEFTEEQVKQFLRMQPNNGQGQFPPWLPTKPLFVSYLASTGLISTVADGEKFPDAAAGWDYLVDQVCEREARIDSRYLDGPTIRKILGRLATYARASDDGLGPLRPEQLKRAYSEVCGFEPDDQAWLILQRLPGLVIYEVEEDSRKFLDGEMVAVYRAGDLVDFIHDPMGSLSSHDLTDALSQCGTVIGHYAVAIAARKLRYELNTGTLQSLITAIPDTSGLNVLRADLLNLAISLRIAVPFPVLIEGVFFQPDPFELDERLPDLRGVTFQDCYFEELHFEAVGTPIPAFRECVVQRLLGRSSYTDLPADRFVNTSVNDFEVAANTNASIRATTNLTTGEKVLLTVLRKLFVQSLGGRSEPALYRGLDTAERQFVDPIVRILAQQQLITLMNRGDGAVWIPVRRKLDYIRKLLANPGSPDDVLMAEARRLSA
ncbi:NACHT domain-containing protein [Burkholderia vietnamiensis]|uniref:NACHT domain-containing protein n=1 Tax=Burkholderia vietnamiensis TaxID=60552 RepID=UPI0012DA44D3|nr:NACHT domain-containing protein [Burkholderia vietnamiensis]